VVFSKPRKGSVGKNGWACPDSLTAVCQEWPPSVLARSTHCVDPVPGDPAVPTKIVEALVAAMEPRKADSDRTDCPANTTPLSVDTATYARWDCKRSRHRATSTDCGAALMATVSNSSPPTSSHGSARWPHVVPPSCDIISVVWASPPPAGFP